MTTSALLWSVLFGSLGAGYCLYARKQRALVPFISGAALIVLPYFIANTFLLVAVCVVCTVAPFVIRP
jgi:VIT1/CCC1 family predicted Fe2+/Mn2+ transporter